MSRRPKAALSDDERAIVDQCKASKARGQGLRRAARLVSERRTAALPLTATAIQRSEAIVSEWWIRQQIKREETPTARKPITPSQNEALRGKEVDIDVRFPDRQADEPGGSA